MVNWSELIKDIKNKTFKSNEIKELEVKNHTFEGNLDSAELVKIRKPTTKRNLLKIPYSTSEEQFNIDFKSSDVDLLEYEGNLEELFEKEIELEVERIHSTGAFLSILVEKLKFWN